MQTETDFEPVNVGTLFLRGNDWLTFKHNDKIFITGGNNGNMVEYDTIQNTT